MHFLIAKLFQDIRSEDKKISEDAAIDLSVILEMHAWNLSKEQRESRYDSLVTHQELFNLELDDSSLMEIVKFMQSEIENGNWLKSSLLSSMGRASARIGLIPLIETIENEIERFNENELYQALIALERIMFWDESLSIQEVRDIFNKTNLLEEIAAKLLSLMPILHSGLESTTARLLSRLILLRQH